MELLNITEKIIYLLTVFNFMAGSPQLTEEQQRQWEEKIRNMSPEELREFQKQQCVFCRIISGLIPAKKVFEDNLCIAVLDIAPAAKGHLLVMPKEHYNIMPQVPDPVLGHIIVVAKRLSQIMLRTLRVSGTTFFAANGTAAGQRAQHFLFHLIPRREGDGLLTFEEKIIDKELVIKVKTALEAKLLELSGLAAAKANRTATNTVIDTENNKESKELPLAKENKVKKKASGQNKSTVKSKTPRQPGSILKKKPKEPLEQPSGSTALDEIANLFK